MQNIHINCTEINMTNTPSLEKDQIPLPSNKELAT